MRMVVMAMVMSAAPSAPSRGKARGIGLNQGSADRPDGDIVEIQPAKDLPCKLTCVTAGRLIVNLIGAAIRAGYFDKGRAGA